MDRGSKASRKSLTGASSILYSKQQRDILRTVDNHLSVDLAIIGNYVQDWQPASF